jgi:Protein of unknown function (DUF1194)
MGAQWHLPDLDRYYVECVIGGPAAFVVPVTGWSEFAVAVRRKLVLELVGRTVPVVPAQYLPDAERPYDCLIGEKIWRNLYEFN